MAENTHRRTRHRLSSCRKRLLQHSKCVDMDDSHKCIDKGASPLLSTVSTSFPNYAGELTSHVTMETTDTHPSCLTGSSSVLPLCKDSSQTLPYSSPSTPSIEKPDELRLSIPSGDEYTNVSSPDSGFESTTPTGQSGSDYFDDNLKADTIDDLSKSSVSTNSSFNSGLLNPLCLTPPPKPKPDTVVKKDPSKPCGWKGCDLVFPTSGELHLHIVDDHVKFVKERFCCEWVGCKVYGVQARNIAWLRQHVSTHTGNKRFKCVLDGCDASFSSRQGMARHVHSHFSEVSLPKARLPGQNERKYLVKRRKIKDKKKALANLHDCMDQRTLNFMLDCLVRRVDTSMTSLKTNLPSNVVCKRRCDDGEEWHLSSGLTWVQNKSVDESRLFFGTPMKRCRKTKAVH